MKILVSLGLEERHLEAIGAVSEQVEVVLAESPQQVLEVAPEIEVVFGGLSREAYQRAARLRWIQSWGAGVDGLLWPELVDSEVVVTSAKGTVGVHLAEHAMALLLALTRGIAWAVRTKTWDDRFPIRHASWELIDRTMGIVGLGGTGRDLAQRAAAFGMRLIAVDPEPVEVPQAVASCWGMDRFGDLLAESDVVAVCAPLTDQTRGMFDREAFARMQSHALLINVTRGQIVDEAALIEALEQGQIAGAGLDVTPQEPLPPDHPLWHMDKVVVTPHTAGGSPNRNDRITELFCDNLRRLLQGRPLLSAIDKKKGY